MIDPRIEAVRGRAVEPKEATSVVTPETVMQRINTLFEGANLEVVGEYRPDTFRVITVGEERVDGAYVQIYRYPEGARGTEMTSPQGRAIYFRTVDAAADGVCAQRIKPSRSLDFSEIVGSGWKRSRNYRDVAQIDVLRGSYQPVSSWGIPSGRVESAITVLTFTDGQQKVYFSDAARHFNFSAEEKVSMARQLGIQV